MKVPWWAWVAWVVLGFALEIAAIFSAPSGDTLTEYTVAAGLTWLVAGFAVWLAIHFGRRLRP